MVKVLLLKVVRTQIDTTPTILQLFVLPIGRDMDGKPLLAAFETLNPQQPPPPAKLGI